MSRIWESRQIRADFCQQDFNDSTAASWNCVEPFNQRLVCAQSLRNLPVQARNCLIMVLDQGEQFLQEEAVMVPQAPS